jgi:PilZ domain
MDRRAATRFLLRAPAIIRWTDAAGAKREDLGRTRDISTSGAFLTCNVALPVGTKVGLEIHLPALERNTLQRVQLKSTGKVIRVAVMAREAGFAVRGPFTLHEQLLGRS